MNVITLRELADIKRDQNNPQRRSAMRCYTDARQYVEASETLFKNGGEISSPTYFCFATSIELIDPAPFGRLLIARVLGFNA
jgi:hypothetical protein